jgi:hypothetical protein
MIRREDRRPRAGCKPPPVYLHVHAGKKGDPRYTDHIAHLPETDRTKRARPGSINHIFFLHDHDCRYWATDDLDDCRCDLVVHRHTEPVRS